MKELMMLECPTAHSYWESLYFIISSRFIFPFQKTRCLSVSTLADPRHCLLNRNKSSFLERGFWLLRAICCSSVDSPFHMGNALSRATLRVKDDKEKLRDKRKCAAFVWSFSALFWFFVWEQQLKMSVKVHVIFGELNDPHRELKKCSDYIFWVWTQF